MSVCPRHQVSHESKGVHLCTHMKPNEYKESKPEHSPTAGIPRLGSRELRASLARSLRRAAAGERIVITDGGVPVAQLGPLDSPGQSTLDELVARGLVVPPRRAQPPNTTPPNTTPPNTTPPNTTRVIDSPIEVWSGVRLEQVVRDLR